MHAHVHIPSSSTVSTLSHQQLLEKKSIMYSDYYNSNNFVFDYDVEDYEEEVKNTTVLEVTESVSVPTSTIASMTSEPAPQTTSEVLPIQEPFGETTESLVGENVSVTNSVWNFNSSVPEEDPQISVANSTLKNLDSNNTSSGFQDQPCATSIQDYLSEIGLNITTVHHMVIAVLLTVCTMLCICLVKAKAQRRKRRFQIQPRERPIVKNQPSYDPSAAVMALRQQPTSITNENASFELNDIDRIYDDVA